MTTFRVHPSIGFARVGNSDEYNLAPETMAALPLPDDGRRPTPNPETVGGLPLRPDGVTTITSRDVRDSRGRLKRQAARFKIFAYDDDVLGRYPTSTGTEITIGSHVDGKRVVDIVWTVHVANKKANCYLLEAPGTTAVYLLSQYENGLTPPLRNVGEGEWAADPERVRKLTIDPGPRAIRGTAKDRVDMGKGGVATYGRGAAVLPVPDYPKSFPDDSFSPLYQPSGPIDTLGDLVTDEVGRLHVVAASGRAAAWYPQDSGAYYPLTSDVDNDGWFDDTADGPVNATLVFEDDTIGEVAGAWVVSTDPGFAPQTLNVVSLWDDIYDTFVRELDLEPELFRGGVFQRGYRPDFAQQLNPIFQAARVQRWNTNLSDGAVQAHDAVGQITADADPSTTILAGLAFIRNPNNPEQHAIGAPLMPAGLGDSGQSMLSVSKTQYFFLEQWDARRIATDRPALGPGEYLDKASLINCLGGRFSPGIDMTFPVRVPETWQVAWRTHGPFRIRQKTLDYAQLPPDGLPLLSEGYVPYHSDSGLEPGDSSKFMSVPWHTDYNSCATHQPDPNPTDSSTLYWSWPAQRPVAVNVAADTRPPETDEQLPGQRWSLRGPGTTSQNYADTGRYQNREDIIPNWWRIGTIMQRTQIEGLDNQDAIDKLPADTFLEVASLFEDDGAPFVEDWPTNALRDD
ncbi:LodA/GoxA family CTQ-dependent oxidase [Actinophytocola sp.]|uniref:LodA/GoxA family CTQ-dependent oxidase n=1 Tax=Actinophytocola sp. TaxID=1872138 RepID=UPI002ED1C628